MSQHIPFAKLADLAEGVLRAEERAASLEHLSGCARCSKELERVEQVVGLMRTDTAEDAPRDVIAYAVNIFRSRRAETAPSLVRRVLAALSFDSASLAPAYGVRSGQSASRQMLYSTGENELDLRVAPGEESSWVVSGQVLGREECVGGQVLLEASGESGAAASSVVGRLNQFCEFTLPPVAAGSYTLRLRLNDLEIEIPEFELRA